MGRVYSHIDISCPLEALRGEKLKSGTPFFSSQHSRSRQRKTAGSCAPERPIESAHPDDAHAAIDTSTSIMSSWSSLRRPWSHLFK